MMQILLPDFQSSLKRGASYEQYLLAACAVARLCLPLVHKDENRPRIAVETVEKWLRGEASIHDLLAQSKASLDSSTIYSDPGYAPARAAYYVGMSAFWHMYTDAAEDDLFTVAVCAVKAGIDSKLITDTISEEMSK